MFKNNQVSNFENFNISNVLFSDPVKGSIPSAPGAPTISYKRIMVGVKNEDGTTGKLLLKMPSNLYCYGVTENKSKETDKVTGHGIACALWDKEKPTSEQKKFTDVFKDITEYMKKHLVENKEAIEKYKLEMHHLDEFKPFYWKTEKGKVVEGKGPTFYPKLIESKKTGKILTMFFDEENNEIDPIELIGKPFYIVDAIVDIESIFIGKDIYMQVKLYEAIIKKKDSGMQRFLSNGAPRRVVNSGMSMTEDKSNVYTLEDSKEEKNTEPEIKDDDDEPKDEEKPKIEEKPKNVRRVVPPKKK